MGPDGDLRLITGTGFRTGAPPFGDADRPAGHQGTVGRAALASGALAALAFLLVLPVKLCLFAIVLGAPCPGCGMTRALLALLRGDVHRALLLNPLAFAIMPLGALVVARHFLAYVRTGDAWRTPATRFEGLAAGALTALLLAVWVARFLGYLGGPVAV